VSGVREERRMNVMSQRSRSATPHFEEISTKQESKYSRRLKQKEKVTKTEEKPTHEQ
jgi:hypothetical protein